MPEVNEVIARLFFELVGFSVATNVKYTSVVNGIPSESDIDLAVRNLRPTRGNTRRPDFILDVDTVRSLRAAIVEVKGWHTTTFSPSIVRETRFSFLDSEAKVAAVEALGAKDFAYVVVLSRVSPDEPWRSQAIEFLKDLGIDHVIEFRTIMEALMVEVDPSRHYRDSEVLQTIRLLKVYETFRRDS